MGRAGTASKKTTQRAAPKKTTQRAAPKKRHNDVQANQPATSDTRVGAARAASARARRRHKFRADRRDRLTHRRAGCGGTDLCEISPGGQVALAGDTFAGNGAYQGAWSPSMGLHVRPGTLNRRIQFDRSLAAMAPSTPRPGLMCQAVANCRPVPSRSSASTMRLWQGWRTSNRGIRVWYESTPTAGVGPPCPGP